MVLTFSYLPGFLVGCQQLLAVGQSCPRSPSGVRGESADRRLSCPLLPRCVIS